MKNYEISVREKPFDPPPVPVDNLLRFTADAPFYSPGAISWIPPRWRVP